MKLLKSKYLKFACILLLPALVLSCSGNTDETPVPGENNKLKTVSQAKKSEAPKEKKADDLKGVGPIKSITISDIDNALANKGKEKFETMCTACHKIEARHIGPALHGVTERRKPEWIMNMILNPEIMVKEDATAKALLGEYIAPMANQNLSEDDARSVLEYFRQYDAQNPKPINQ
jgi:mono/diheme cytochrome c family protein